MQYTMLTKALYLLSTWKIIARDFWMVMCRLFCTKVQKHKLETSLHKNEMYDTEKHEYER